MASPTLCKHRAMQDFIHFALKELKKGIDAKSVQCLLFHCHLATAHRLQTTFLLDARKYVLSCEHVDYFAE